MNCEKLLRRFVGPCQGDDSVTLTFFQGECLESTLIKVGIFTATSWEFAAVARALPSKQRVSRKMVQSLIGQQRKIHVSVFRTGMGAHNASSACRESLARDHWDLIISSGFAGALTASFIGSIVVANEVLLESSCQPCHQSGPLIPCHPQWRAKAFQVAKCLDRHAQCGRIVTVPRIVGQAREKQNIAEKTGALALDMESGPLGSVAQEASVPFLAIRAISDLCDEDLPVDFNAFLRPLGCLQGLARVLVSPVSWLGFARLRAQMIQASSFLTLFFETLLNEMRSGSIPMKEDDSAREPA